MTATVFNSIRKRRALAPRRIRVGFLVTGLSLAVVLVSVTLSAWLSARALAETVTRGQGAMIVNGLRDVAHPGPGGPSDEALARDIAALDELGELAISYAEVLYPDHSAGPRYGAPARPIPPEELHRTIRDGLVRERGIARVAVPVPPMGPRPPPGLGSPGRPPPGHHPPPGPPGPPAHLVVEFEPTLAARLERGALRELIVGIAGATIMILASLVFWRLSAASERAEQDHAQQRQLAVLGEMSAVLAHELRNPLASLKGHAQLLVEKLERDQAEPRTTSKAARVVAEAQRLEQLTHGLLTFVRIGALTRTPASPRAIVDGALADLEHQRVDVDDEQAPKVWALDGPRIQQVIANLVDNALQAVPDQRVTLRIGADAQRLWFEVDDRGPGVPRDQRDRIFQPFHTTRVRGTGLGLAVSRRIVELHGGLIEVADNPGGGARFRVTIPVEVSTAS